MITIAVWWIHQDIDTIIKIFPSFLKQRNPQATNKHFERQINALMFGQRQNAQKNQRAVIKQKHILLEVQQFLKVYLSDQAFIATDSW